MAISIVLTDEQVQSILEASGASQGGSTGGQGTPVPPPVGSKASDGTKIIEAPPVTVWDGLPHAVNLPNGQTARVKLTFPASGRVQPNFAQKFGKVDDTRRRVWLVKDGMSVDVKTYSTDRRSHPVDGVYPQGGLIVNGSQSGAFNVTIGRDVGVTIKNGLINVEVAPNSVWYILAQNKNSDGSDAILADVSPNFSFFPNLING